jgi:glycosyltransferase involved in cell wall biosynthesis
MFNEGKIYKDISKIQDLDIIFQCGSTPGLTLKNNNNIPILWNPDGIEWKRKKFKWYGRLILYLSTKRGIKNSHAVTLDSKELHKEMKTIINNKPIYYLPSGANIIHEKDTEKRFLKEFGIEEKGYFIVVGRAVPENHILEILKYFNELNSHKKLLLVTNLSDNNYSKKLKRVIKNSKNIIYKGPIYDYKKLNSLRYYAYAYIHGHSVGGTNPSLLESLGAGNPVICYDVPYNKEVAKNAGVFFQDKTSFFNSIKKIENDIKLRNELSKNALKNIEENYTWDFITELHEVVAMHSLVMNNKLNEKEYLNWLKTKKYYNKFTERNFDNFKKGLIR